MSTKADELAQLRQELREVREQILHLRLRAMEINPYWDADDQERFVTIVKRIAQNLGLRRVIYAQVSDDGRLRASMDGWMDYLETRQIDEVYFDIYAYEVQHS